MGTGIEPHRKPTGFGVAISNVPTQRSSPPEFSEFDDDDDDFAIGTYSDQTTTQPKNGRYDYFNNLLTHDS